MSQFITKIYTESTGSGCQVDFFELTDGRVIGLSGERIVLYPSAAAIRESDGEGEFPMIVRNILPVVVKSPRLGRYADALAEEYTMDVITLATGEVLGVDSESVCLYGCMASLLDAEPDCVIGSISLHKTSPSFKRMDF